MTVLVWQKESPNKGQWRLGSPFSKTYSTPAWDLGLTLSRHASLALFEENLCPRIRILSASSHSFLDLQK